MEWVVFSVLERHLFKIPATFSNRSVQRVILCHILIVWRNSPQWAREFLFTRFLDHTQRSTTVGKTARDE